MTKSKKMENRCPWCGDLPIYVDYHDTVWGVPTYDSKELFAKLILDGAQAGLSWITILKRQENYYNAFDGLDPDKMADYDENKIQALLQDKGIIRNKLKVRAAVTNAQAYHKIESEFGSFSDFLWQFVNNKPIVNHYKSTKDVPTSTPQSDAMSKALKKMGFKFVGTTIVYAFMQAVGMVNDHLVDCPRWLACQGIEK